MKLSSVEQRIPLWYKAGLSIHLTSEPGIGKTSVLKAAPGLIKARTGLDIGVYVINGAMLTPMDVLGFGLPKHYPDRSVMVFSEPFFFTVDGDRRMCDYDGGILVVDEADKADPDVKKIIGEGALSQSFGPHKMPPGWFLWTAGNRSVDRSGTTKELDHLINRRTEIKVTPDIESWVNWAVTHGVMPLTIAFAVQNTQIVFSGTVPEKQGPWCTARSLVRLDSYYRMLSGGGPIPEDQDAKEEACGTIGDAAAAQYFSFIQLDREMPSYETIRSKPMEVKVPIPADAKMLVCYTLASRVSADDIAAVSKYVGRMGKEFGALFSTAACKRDMKLAFTPTMQKWAMDNSSLMATISQ